MSGTEALVIAICLVAGYWIVLKLMSRPPPGMPAPRQNPNGGGFEQVPPWSQPDGPNAASWNGVLGIGAEATVEEIRRAYKDQSARYHLEKVTMLGPEIQALAERRSQEISMAYRRGMRERGVSEQLW